MSSLSDFVLLKRSVILSPPLAWKEDGTDERGAVEAGGCRQSAARRSLIFDADDRAAACRELNHRYLGITRPSAVPRYEAMRDAGRDLARLRAALPDDFVFHDRRRTGLGGLDGADAYVASVAALHELAPDATVGQPLHYLIDELHGALSIAHSFGTLAEGGTYESVYVMLQLYGPDGMGSAELFELDDLEAAKARFEELGATRTA